MDKMRVLLVIENQILQAGVKDIFTSDTAGVVGLYATMDKALSAISELVETPDVVIWDGAEQSRESTRMLHTLVERRRLHLLLLVDAYTADAYTLARKARALGMLTRDTSAEALRLVAMVIALGQRVYPGPGPGFAANDIGEGTDPELTAAFTLNHLSPREREILGYHTAGLNTTEILSRLNVVHSTFKSQQKSLYRKLGVHSLAEAITMGVKLGLAS